MRTKFLAVMACLALFASTNTASAMSMTTVTFTPPGPFATVPVPESDGTEGLFQVVAESGSDIFTVNLDGIVLTSSDFDSVVSNVFTISNATFRSDLQAALADGMMDFSFGPSTGSWSSATVSYAAVPEPATMTLFGIGAIVCGGAYRRRRRTVAAA